MEKFNELNWFKGKSSDDIAFIRLLQDRYNDYLLATNRRKQAGPLGRIFIPIPKCPEGNPNAFMNVLKKETQKFCLDFSQEHGLGNAVTWKGDASLSVSISPKIELNDDRVSVSFTLSGKLNDTKLFRHRHETFNTDGRITGTEGPAYPYSESGTVLELNDTDLNSQPELTDLAEKYLVARGDLQAVLSQGRNLDIIRSHNEECDRLNKVFWENTFDAFNDLMEENTERLKEMNLSDSALVDDFLASSIASFMTENKISGNDTGLLCWRIGSDQFTDKVRKTHQMLLTQMNRLEGMSEIDRIRQEANTKGADEKSTAELTQYAQKALEDVKTRFANPSTLPGYTAFMENNRNFSSEYVSDEQRYEWYHEYTAVNRTLQHAYDMGLSRSAIKKTLSVTIGFNNRNPLLSKSDFRENLDLNEIIDDFIRDKMNFNTNNPLGKEYLLTSTFSEKPLVLTLDDNRQVIVTGLHRQKYFEITVDGIEIPENKPVKDLKVSSRRLFEINTYLKTAPSLVKKQDLQEQQDLQEKNVYDLPADNYRQLFSEGSTIIDAPIRTSARTPWDTGEARHEQAYVKLDLKDGQIMASNPDTGYEYGTIDQWLGSGIVLDQRPADARHKEIQETLALDQSQSESASLGIG